MLEKRSRESMYELEFEKTFRKLYVDVVVGGSSTC